MLICGHVFRLLNFFCVDVFDIQEHTETAGLVFFTSEINCSDSRDLTSFRVVPNDFEWFSMIWHGLKWLDTMWNHVINMWKHVYDMVSHGLTSFHMVWQTLTFFFTWFDTVSRGLTEFDIVSHVLIWSDIVRHGFNTPISNCSKQFWKSEEKAVLLLLYSFHTSEVVSLPGEGWWLESGQRRPSHPTVEKGTWLFLGLVKGKAARQSCDHIIVQCVDRSWKILALALCLVEVSMTL